LFGHVVLENLIQAFLRIFRHRFKDFQGPTRALRLGQGTSGVTTSRSRLGLGLKDLVHIPAAQSPALLDVMAGVRYSPADELLTFLRRALCTGGESRWNCW